MQITKQGRQAHLPYSRLLNDDSTRRGEAQYNRHRADITFDD